MHVRRLAGCVLACGLFVLPSLAAAQSASSGSIAGVVKDTSGSVLPGVTVEAASPVLIEKVRSVVTDDQGNYKIVGLRPGNYTVTFTLPGFSTFKREGLDLSTGFTANITAEMKVGGLEETITVTGASPVVDVQNVRQQTVFRREVQEALPLGRNMAQWATTMPGATLSNVSQGQDVGGTTPKGIYIGMHGIVGTYAMGQFLDGMRFSVQFSSVGLILNAAGTEETQLQTSGIGAESQNGSVQMNVVPREGGNRLKAFATGGYTNSGIQADNITAALRARGAAGAGDLKVLWVFNGGFGGPLKRDKLWFYTAHQRTRLQRYQPGNFYNSTLASLFYTPDPSHQAVTDDSERDHQVRLTFQASRRNKLNFHLYMDGSCQCRFLTGIQAPEASARIVQNFPLVQGTWSFPKTNKLLFEAGITYANQHSNKPLQPEVAPGTISILESSTNFRYRSGSLVAAGGYGLDLSDQFNERVSTAYITGSHAFKVGLQTLQGKRTDRTDYAANTSYTFTRGVPISITQYVPLLLVERVEEIGIYAQDQWTLKRWTFNLGARFDYFHGHTPEQQLPVSTHFTGVTFPAVDNIPNWKDVTPRLGVAYDIFGNGKTAIKAALGRYVDLENTSTAVTPSNPTNTMVTQATRTWNDANRDFVPQESELGVLSNANFGKAIPGTVQADDVLHGWGARDYNWQTSVQVQQELGKGIGLNVGYFRTWFGNNVAVDNLLVAPADYAPYCITPPRDARLPGGGGQQICGLYDISPAKFGQVQNLVTHASNFGKSQQFFNGVDATVDMRLPRGLLITGGMSTGQSVTDNCSSDGPRPDFGTVGGVSRAALVDTPQKQFCHTSPSWINGTQVKFSVIYPLPWEVRVSGVFQNSPGIPVTSQYLATNAEIAPSLGRNLGQCRGAATCNGTALVELIAPGSQFEDRLTQLDLRLTRSFRVGSTRLQANFDIFNALNGAAVLGINTRYGASWLTPSATLNGRMLKLGFQFDF